MTELNWEETSYFNFGNLMFFLIFHVVVAIIALYLQIGLLYYMDIISFKSVYFVHTNLIYLLFVEYKVHIDQWLKLPKSKEYGFVLLEKTARTISGQTWDILLIYFN